MSISFTAFALLPLLSGLVLAGLAIHGWLRRSESSVAIPFVALLWSIAVRVLCDGIGLLFGDLDSKILLTKLRFLGSLFAHPAAFLISLHATGMLLIPGQDSTSFPFTITGVALTWSLLRYGLLDVIRVRKGASCTGWATA
jgi:hypothetical protein